MSSAYLGGALIGLSATILLAFNGRVSGISGILNQFLLNPFSNARWRGWFLGGLVSAGFLLHFLKPELFANTSGRSFLEILVAGFLVGFGAVMASGCTSGHGVCGVSRLSLRSIVATIIFICAGMGAVYFMRFIGWSL